MFPRRHIARQCVRRRPTERALPIRFAGGPDAFVQPQHRLLQQPASMVPGIRGRQRPHDQPVHHVGVRVRFRADRHPLLDEPQCVLRVLDQPVERLLLQRTVAQEPGLRRFVQQQRPEDGMRRRQLVVGKRAIVFAERAKKRLQPEPNFLSGTLVADMYRVAESEERKTRGHEGCLIATLKAPQPIRPAATEQPADGATGRGGRDRPAGREQRAQHHGGADQVRRATAVPAAGFDAA